MTIAIVGNGVAGLSILFSLARNKYPGKVILFHSTSFASPCSLNSTAIVAPRGVTTGISSLGDELVQGFQRFQKHVNDESPAGVLRVPQITGALTKIDSFKKRYPAGEITDGIYFAREEAFLIRPREYLDWLLSEAKKNLDLEIIPSFVTQVEDNKISTQDNSDYLFDRIIFAAGVQNELWSGKSTKTVQGCYLEFQNVLSDESSFSLTLEGNNLIFDRERMILLIGSTSRESSLSLPPENELLKIYQFLKQNQQFPLPDFNEGQIRVGLREKGPKRQAYILHQGNRTFVGGLYKNGYSLSLHLAEKLWDPKSCI